MTTSRFLLKVSALAALAALATVPVAAQMAPNCDWYAKTAQKQQQDNERLKCALLGPEWSVDIKTHVAWCQSVAPDVWKAMAQKRDQQLAECQKQKK